LIDADFPHHRIDEEAATEVTKKKTETEWPLDLSVARFFFPPSPVKEEVKPFRSPSQSPER